jgi:hypothetical protein
LSAVIRFIAKEYIENVQQKKDDGSARYSMPTFTADQARSFRSTLRFLNDKDRDILYLMFVSKKKQRDVLKILGRTQSSLVYDIKRIRRRLRFIFYLQSVFDIFTNFIHSQREYFTPEEMAILTLMFYSSSFTLTSEIMGISQVRVRYAYNKCLRHMEELEMWDAYEIFMVIRSNLNTVRRVYKGAGRRPGETCLVI